MSRWAGVIRDADGLGRLVRLLGDGGAGRGDHAPVRDDAGGAAAGDTAAGLDAVEADSLRTVSLLIAAGAQRRAESRGCHRRRDAVATAAPRHTLAWFEGQRLVVTEEEL
jgi:L-aspartate oxidase